MTLARVSASLAPAAFALLAAVLAALGAVPTVEAGWAAVAVALGFLPTGWLAPAGWRRRAAESSLLAPALALTLIADPTMRRMALPPLLALAAWAAAAAALRRAGRHEGALISAGLALAVRAAGALGLAGSDPPTILLALITPPAAAWGLSRAAGPLLGLPLLLGALPLERSRLAAVGLLVGGLLLARIRRPLPVLERALRGFSPALPAAALVLAAISPWGGLEPARALPDAGWPAALSAAAVGAAAIWLPPAAGGAAWLAATLALGPLQPPPPDRPGVELTAAAPTAQLPAAEHGGYVVDLALANGASVPAGRPIAHAGDVTLRAGVDAAEWAHQRADVRAVVAHPLPAWPVWRPTGLGADALWAVSGRSTYALARGERPRITRDGRLPPEVVVSVVTAGSGRPTPPRSWPLPVWILATALAVALLQTLSGTWRTSWSAVPWAVLIGASLVTRMPIEPLRLLAERHAVDIALFALVAAWIPAARHWSRRRLVFVPAAALLLPLAIATTHLTPPLGDEPYHLLLLDSLRHDHDLAVNNNIDLESHPEYVIYRTPGWFIHSPVFALLLLPAFLVVGRSGAVAMMALAGAATVALIARAASTLGVSRSRTLAMAAVLLVSYPVVTFSTQIWPEIPAALLACLLFLWVTRSRPPAIAASVLTVLATWVKTRMGLLLFPLAVAAWWPAGRRTARSPAPWLAAALTAAAALALGWVWFGNPLDPVGRRTIDHLVPTDPTLALRVVGGLTFDAAAGLAFAAPLCLAGVAGFGALWRTGKAGRALLLGSLFTVLALLSNQEWRGGASPPARYLVPLLGAFALGLALLLKRPRRWRPLLAILLPPSTVVAWAFVTRPNLAYNFGDGGHWLADAVARRFLIDARDLLPSFLRPSPATWIVPLALGVGAALGVMLARQWPSLARAFGRGAVALWLTAASAFIVAAHVRHDRQVELEDPQIAHLGGQLEPPPEQMSRFLFPNGWRLADGDRVIIPLSVTPGTPVFLEGWLDGESVAGASLLVSWDGGAPVPVTVAGRGVGRVRLPAAPQDGRQRLSVAFAAPSGGTVVLDRVMVEP